MTTRCSGRATKLDTGELVCFATFVVVIFATEPANVLQSLVKFLEGRVVRIRLQKTSPREKNILTTTIPPFYNGH